MLKTIRQNISKIDTHFRSTNPTMNERERIFSRAIKLNEEVGELCEAILHENDSNQRRKEKIIDLDAELADVIICTLLLAEGREKNIWSEIEKKLAKQLERFNIQ